MSGNLSLQERFDEAPALDYLTPFRRFFVMHYVLGDDETRGVQGRAYAKASEEYAGMPTITSRNPEAASGVAGELMKHPDVQRAIKELQAHVEQTFRNRLRSWTEMAINAQEALHLAVLTVTDRNLPPEKKVFLSPTQLAACAEVLDRSIGKPKQTNVHEIGDKLEDLIKRLSGTRPMDAPALSPMDEQKFIGEGSGTVSRPHLVREEPDDG